MAPPRRRRREKRSACLSYQYWSVQQRSFEQGFHIPESYEFHKAEITIAQAVAGIEIAKVVVDVAMTVSALMNVLEEPLQTPSRYQRIMLEDDETAQSPVVSSGPARNPSGLMFALDFLYFWFHPLLKRCGTRRQDNCGHSLGA